LPLAHNFGRLMHLAGPYAGYTIAFCPDPYRVGEALVAVRPTIFPSVPRVYEKVHTAVTANFDEATGAKRKLIDWALRVGRRASLLRREGRALPSWLALQHRLADRLVYSKIKQRLGTLAIATRDPAEVEAAFRETPAVHRFPGSMATRVQDLCALVDEEYGGDASRLWREATDSDDLRKRISALPGFGEMKIKALSAVLWKRFGVKPAEGLAPSHPTLGDVDSREALEAYQEKKRTHKAKMRAQKS